MCNPYGKGHNWVKTYFIAPAPAGVPIHNQIGQWRVRIHGRLHENHKTQVPTYVFFGFDPRKAVVIGPNPAIVDSNTEAKASLLETPGKGAEVGLKNLENLENQMRVMGSELRIRRPGGSTATQHVLESGLDRALQIMGEMMGRKPEPVIGVRVNTEFGPTFAGGAELAEWGKARARCRARRSWGRAGTRGRKTSETYNGGIVQRLALVHLRQGHQPYFDSRGRRHAEV